MSDEAYIIFSRASRLEMHWACVIPIFLLCWISLSVAEALAVWSLDTLSNEPVKACRAI